MLWPLCIITNCSLYVLGNDVTCYICVAVMYSDELQSVCEGKLGAWGVETSLDMLKL